MDKLSCDIHLPKMIKMLRSVSRDHIIIDSIDHFNFWEFGYIIKYTMQF